MIDILSIQTLARSNGIVVWFHRMQTQDPLLCLMDLPTKNNPYFGDNLYTAILFKTCVSQSKRNRQNHWKCCLTKRSYYFLFNFWAKCPHHVLSQVQTRPFGQNKRPLVALAICYKPRQLSLLWVLVIYVFVARSWRANYLLIYLQRRSQFDEIRRIARLNFLPWRFFSFLCFSCFPAKKRSLH